MGAVLARAVYDIGSSWRLKFNGKVMRGGRRGRSGEGSRDPLHSLLLSEGGPRRQAAFGLTLAGRTKHAARRAMPQSFPARPSL